MEGFLAVNNTSSDFALIGILVLLLNVFLFLFLVYIFPFFIYFLTGRFVYGKLKVVTVFCISLTATLILAFLAAYTLSFDYILLAISTAFILFALTGFALITGYCIFDHRYPKEHKWIPYILSSVAAGAYMIYSFGFPLRSPAEIYSHLAVEMTGADIIFLKSYSSLNFFPEYYGNFSLWLSYFGYYLEVLLIGIVIFYLMGVLMEKAFYSQG